MSIDLNTHYGRVAFAEWENKLALHETWWKTERGKPVNGSPTEARWKPSPSLLCKYFKLGSSERVLDIGCGDGHREAHFSTAQYIGIDPIILREQYPFAFYRGFAEFLPFVDGCFDVVMSVESLDHMLDPRKAIKEALRVLKRGGNLFLFVGTSEQVLSEVRDECQKPAYSIDESDVHLHNFCEGYFAARLRNAFDTLDIDHEDRYLAVWGWGKKYEPQ